MHGKNVQQNEDERDRQYRLRSMESDTVVRFLTDEEFVAD